MATCKDCFHWEACKAMAETMGFRISDDFHGCADRCKTFVNAADVALIAEVTETDHHPLDEQIIKALEATMYDNEVCRAAYDLIMRQRREIEGLQMRIDALNHTNRILMEKDNEKM